MICGTYNQFHQKAESFIDPHSVSLTSPELRCIQSPRTTAVFWQQ